MRDKTTHARDPFTISLGGVSICSSFAHTPAIARDRINSVLDQKFRKMHEDQPDTARELTSFWGRFWLRARRRAA
ncbi:MAG: hypothetical protein KJO82_11925 [Gammaproteobacteria bacterium]|nr:hypothetical protein [Gammaproteobacteria bacterium]